ncbi:MAG TPA: hypothetical protein VK174_14565, partial [Chitinophagales bacterium]|nr:hypothetical protein [Chitinophagales bacterium]
MNAGQVFNLVVTKEFPASVVHFLTDKCNARCSFCFIDFHSPLHGKNELTLEEIVKVTQLLPRS